MSPSHPNTALAITVDSGFTDGATVTLASCLLHAPRNTFSHLYLIDAGEEGETESLEQIRTLWKRLSDSDCTFVSKKSSSEWTTISYASTYGIRPYLWMSLPGQLHENRILFLDADLLVTIDISAILNLNFQGHAVAAVRDVCPNLASDCPCEETIAEHGSSHYMNTGVVVVDVARWKEDRVEARVLDFLRTYESACRLWDQTALNGVLHGKYFALPHKYNLPPDSAGITLDLPILPPGVYHLWKHFKPWQNLMAMPPSASWYGLYAVLHSESTLKAAIRSPRHLRQLLMLSFPVALAVCYRLYGKNELATYWRKLAQQPLPFHRSIQLLNRIRNESESWSRISLNRFASGRGGRH